MRFAWVGGLFVGLLIIVLFYSWYTPTTLETPPRSPSSLLIRIAPNAWKDLTRQLDIALQRGFILPDSEKFVPAIVEWEGKTMDAKVRLKGDFLDHLKGDKWSLKIKIMGEGDVRGMRVFSVQHPRTRNYVYEWLLHTIARKIDVHAVRYTYLPVVLNGKKMGLYAMEEDTSDMVLGKRGSGSVVLHFNDDFVWQEMYEKSIGSFTRNWSAFNQYLSAPIVASVPPEFQHDPQWQAEAQKAVQLLDRYRKGEGETDHVLDLPAFARYVALADLMGAHHMLIFFNLPLFFNRETHLLEPIVYDGDAGKNFGQVTPRRIEIHYEFWTPLFQNPQFMSMYHEELLKISDPGFLDGLLSEYGRRLNRYQGLLEQEYPDAYFFESILYENQQRIQRYLETVGKKPREESIHYTGLPLFNKVTMDISQKRRPYSFLLAGHIYGSRDPGKSHPAETFMTSIPRFKELMPEFMVVLGDVLFRGGGDEQKKLEETMNMLPFSVLHIVGNHDSLYREKYREEGKRTWRGFRSATELFLILDSENDDGRIIGHQLEWLEAQINRFKAGKNLKNLFIFSHRLVWAMDHPVLKEIIPYVNGPIHHEGREGTIVQKILPMLKDIGDKHVYFVSGDIGHSYSLPLFYHQERGENITYIATGIGDTDHDAVIEVRIDAAGNVDFVPHSLMEKEYLPIEEYGLEYWKEHFKNQPL